MLLGAAIFVVSCFLPYFDSSFGAGRDPAGVSLYDQLQVGSDEWTLDLGTFLLLFGAVAVVVAVAIVGVTRRGYRVWTPGMLGVAILAWASTWFGVLLRQVSFVSSVVPETSLTVGFWLQAVSILVVVLGTVAGLITARRGAHERHRGDDR
ncbi:MAG TPA: hypothetical protein VJ913_10090 [Actinomycetota bacterium]|nr:hypothetical protein [Actinomycetota bacterium]